MSLTIFGTRGDVALFFTANAVGFERPKARVFKEKIWSPGAYINNRTLQSHPPQWSTIMRLMLNQARKLRSDFNGVASVASGGVPHGIALARDLVLPHFTVKKQEKEAHGLAGLIDGDVALLRDRQLLLVEDMSSTFKSSLRAMEPLVGAGAKVAHTLLLNTWGFPEFHKNIAGHSVYALCSGKMIVDFAAESGKLDHEYEATVRHWLEHPEDRRWSTDGTWVLPEEKNL
jgi:orotate phosphoribosyltransferase